MADEVKEEKVAVEPEKSTGTDEILKTPQQEKREAVEEALEKGEASEPPAEESEETEETEEVEETEETSPAEKTDEEEKEVEPESFIKEEKSNVQKRIDALVAKNKELEEELKNKPAQPVKERIFTDEELRQATAKAMENSDASLMWSVMEQKSKQDREALRKEYIEEQKKQQETQQQRNIELVAIKDSYSYLSDPKEPEVYEGSRKELNVNDPKSTLVQLATSLYQDPERVSVYQKAGGLQLAVSDAVNLILKKRLVKRPKNKETAKLERKLAKQKRKSSLAGSGEEPPAKSPKEKGPRSRKNILDEYLSDRNTRKTKAMEAQYK
jgi:hypothetical protein